MSLGESPRLHFIELLAYWEGRVNAGDVSQQFDISRQQAQASIKKYQERAPENLYYDTSIKAHLPSSVFNRLLISSDAHDYLYWLKTGDLQPAPRVFVTALTLPPLDKLTQY